MLWWYRLVLRGIHSRLFNMAGTHLGVLLVYSGVIFCEKHIFKQNNLPELDMD